MKINRLRYNIELTGSFFRRAYKKVLRRDAPYPSVNIGKVITKPVQANALIAEKILLGEPFMAARFGSVELSALVDSFRKSLGKIDAYGGKTRQAMCMNAGFFPDDEEMFDRFAALMTESCAMLDIIGLWNDYLELFTVRTFAPQAAGMKLYCMEPYYDLNTSWTHALQGKKVLVVSPFAETINRQFVKKEHFFAPDFWPECELVTVKAVQTIAGEKDDRFPTWFDALEYMKKEISGKSFCVAVIGCGAYGFPLAAYVKRIGKQAIHLGGATQLLFGIRGKRWDDTEISQYFNEYWTRPNTAEKPQTAYKIENGCYW